MPERNVEFNGTAEELAKEFHEAARRHCNIYGFAVTADRWDQLTQARREFLVAICKDLLGETNA